MRSHEDHFEVARRILQTLDIALREVASERVVTEQSGTARVDPDENSFHSEDVIEANRSPG
jgi:hypothetical protein